MRKIALLVVALMMVASVALAQQKIAAADLHALKGTWTGMISFQVGVNCPVEVTFVNDTVPVEGRIMVTMIPDNLGTQIGISGGTFSSSNPGGTITTQGSLMFAGNKNFMEFFLKGNKLDGWFYYNGAKGDILLHKK